MGQWKNNLQNGLGIHIWYDTNNENKFFRNRYIGEWKDGKRNGYGKFFYNNGCVYEGFWKNNKKDGFGIYYYFDKTRYVGNFKDDIMIDKLSQEQINLLINKNGDVNNNQNPIRTATTKKLSSKIAKINQADASKAPETNSNTKKTPQTKEA